MVDDAARFSAAPRWDATKATIGLFARAALQARRLGETSCSEAHALLALLDPPADTVARTVLNELELDTGDVERAWSAWRGDDPPPDDELVRSTPALHGLFGIAAGLALAQGATEATDEHLLLALCFSEAAALLRACDLDPDEVLTALARHGVPVPPLLPPADDPPPPGPWHHYVMAPAVAGALIEAMVRQYGVGAEWGVNTEGAGTDHECVVISATARLDLPALIDRLGMGDAVRRRGA